jgi:hypothetical protein
MGNSAVERQACRIDDGRWAAIAYSGVRHAWALPTSRPLRSGGVFLGMTRLCNLYSLTKGQQAIRELSRAMVDRTGNMPLLPGIFPDYAAPIVRNQPDGRELTTARWGMPSPVFALKGRNSPILA